MTLVVLEGDFDASRAQKGTGRVQYIGWIFDLEKGLPTIARYSADGRGFGRALNDPKLGDEPRPPGPPPASPQTQPPPGQQITQNRQSRPSCGDTPAPTAIPPRGVTPH
jgi:hypothetical protein